MLFYLTQKLVFALILKNENVRFCEKFSWLFFTQKLIYQFSAGVMPDGEMEDMLLNIFGEKGYPLRKFWRMMYWMPKFKNLSPWPVPDPLPNDVFELAKIAIARISSADIHSQLTIYQTANIKDSIEDTWIVSAQSPKQKKLLETHDKNQPIYVEGAFKVWIKNKAVNYFVLKGNPKPRKDDEIENPDGGWTILMQNHFYYNFLLQTSLTSKCLYST